MTRYRKKPVVIDAVRWRGDNLDQVLTFVYEDDRWKEGIDDGYIGGPGIGHTPALGTLDIPTLEGTLTAQAGDWIIRGVKGELYPCKPDIFEATHEPVEELTTGREGERLRYQGALERIAQGVADPKGAAELALYGDWTETWGTFVPEGPDAHLAETQSEIERLRALEQRINRERYGNTHGGPEGAET